MTPKPQPAQHAPFAPLERPLILRETVLEELRAAIITGELREGELVSAPSLGQALGVSATPVREAMMDLVREGLVETVKNKGFRITTMSDKDLDDLAQIRLMLEPPAMRMIAGTIPDAAYRSLEKLADESVHAAEQDRVSDYLRLDREFHAQLLAFLDNAQLVELATSLRRRTRLYGIAAVAKEGRLAKSAEEHRGLLRLLRAGDGEASERLMRTHIGHARKLWATGVEEEAETE